MPSYDFRCKNCRATFSLVYSSYAEREAAEPVCPRCKSPDLSRLIRRVSLMTNEDTRAERLADPSRLGALDESDPRSLGRMMREMVSETGEDPGAEFHEVVDRLESGENPDSIEQSMPNFGNSLPGGDADIASP